MMKILEITFSPETFLIAQDPKPRLSCCYLFNKMGLGVNSKVKMDTSVTAQENKYDLENQRRTS